MSSNTRENMRGDVRFVTYAPLLAFPVLLAIGITQLPWSAERAVGLVLTVAGIVGVTVARFHLGNSFSVTPQARKLVTTGIYSKVRHPVYVFSALAVAGLMIFWSVEVWLLLLIALLPVQIVRARKEEAILENTFGDEYRRYRQRTWF